MRGCSCLADLRRRAASSVRSSLPVVCIHIYIDRREGKDTFIACLYAQHHHVKTAALDLYLGIDLGAPSASSRNSYGFVRSMRAYMPRPHARFLEALEADMKGPPNLRGYVAALQQREGKEGEAAVVAAYNACVGALVAFRRAHLSIVQTFILRQQEAGEGDSGGAGLEKAAGGKGTGGMPLVEFLAPIKAETEAAKLLGGNGKD